MRQLPPAAQVHIAKADSYDADLAAILQKLFEHFRPAASLAGKRVVLKDNKTEERQVRIGMNNNVQAQVLEGLEVGERVVSAEAAPAVPGA